jgi:hypothetical protein
MEKYEMLPGAYGSISRALGCTLEGRRILCRWFIQIDNIIHPDSGHLVVKK